MKKNKLYLIGVLLSAVSFVGCSDFLSPFANGTITDEDFWDYPSYVQGLVGQGYYYMSTNYSDTRGFYFDGATDDLVTTSVTHNMNRFGTGSMGTSNDPFETPVYSYSYIAIQSMNRFLEDDKGYNTTYSIDEREDYLIRTRLQGEAYALRAWFHWQLLMYYGGVGISSGDLLGVPFTTDVIDDVNEDQLATGRLTYEESMAQIESDIDEACKYLAVAHRDWLKEYSTDIESGAMLWGCMDQMATQAVLADMYLTYASPLFNPTDDSDRWETAAKQALKVIAMKINIDGVDGSGYFSETARVNWNDPNFNGIIFPSRYASANLTTENAFYPASVGGNGSVGATQEFVDAFPMANGYPITDSRSNYDPQDPYTGRDQRFYSAVFYNGSSAYIASTGALVNTFASYTGADDNTPTGADYAGNLSTSLTNYHIKKYIYKEYSPYITGKTTGGPRSKYYYRWADMMLAFAEAANEVGGPDAQMTVSYDGPVAVTTMTMSAKEAIASLRKRNTWDNETSSYATEDLYLDEVAAKGKDAFRELIRNERRLETCFEGLRYFDLRRWSTESDLSLLNTTVHRPEIKKDSSGNVTYSESGSHVPVVVHKFTSPYIPLPYSEMLKVSELEQNKGWDSWM